MEIIIGALAAWGLLMLLWTLWGVFFLPLSRREDLRLTVLVRGNGETPVLERYVRGLIWLRDLGLLWWDILIIQDGLGDHARETAQRLSETKQATNVVSEADLKDWLD